MATSSAKLMNMCLVPLGMSWIAEELI